MSALQGLDWLPLYGASSAAVRRHAIEVLESTGADPAAPLLTQRGWERVGNVLVSDARSAASHWSESLGRLIPQIPQADLGTTIGRERATLLRARGIGEWGDLARVSVVEAQSVLGPVATQELLSTWIALVATDAQADVDLLTSASPVYDAVSRVLHTIRNLRALNIWWSRHVGFGRAPTLRELGANFGVSGERVRQLEDKGERAAKPFVQRLVRGPVGVAAEQLRAQLGTMYPTSDLSWPALGLTAAIAGAAPDIEDFSPAQMGLLLLCLAGPYALRGEWLELPNHDRMSVRDAVRVAVRDVVGQEVGLPVNAAQDVLEAAGVVPSVRARLLASIDEVTRIDDKLFPWPDDATIRMETVLSARGAPMGKHDLARAVGRNLGTVGNILANSPIFKRRDVDLYGLAEWPGEQYVSALRAMEDAIRAHGGVASREAIFNYVLSRFTVAESSINTYLNSSRFVSAGRGQYRIRGQSERPNMVVNVALEEAATCFHLPDGWALRLRLNDDRVRGSGIGITQAFAAHVGLEHGDSVLHQVEDADGNELGWIKFYWPDQMPAVGSMSQIVNQPQLDLRLNDWLFLVWDAQREVIRFVATGAPSDLSMTEYSVRARIGVSIGRPEIAGASTEAALRALAEALGLPPDAGRLQVIQRLRVRRDDELIDQCRVLYDLQALRLEDTA